MVVARSRIPLTHHFHAGDLVFECRALSGTFDIEGWTLMEGGRGEF